MKLNDSEPKILFHYTSIETLIKILDTIDDKICFWATHARYFNDPRSAEAAPRFGSGCA